MKIGNLIKRNSEWLDPTYSGYSLVLYERSQFENEPEFRFGDPEENEEVYLILDEWLVFDDILVISLLTGDTKVYIFKKELKYFENVQAN